MLGFGGAFQMRAGGTLNILDAKREKESRCKLKNSGAPEPVVVFVHICDVASPYLAIRTNLWERAKRNLRARRWRLGNWLPGILRQRRWRPGNPGILRQRKIVCGKKESAPQYKGTTRYPASKEREPTLQ